jgi:hypothetical protein
MDLLVGDRERDRTAKELQRHYLEGRLSLEELARRLDTALQARTGVQLRAALNELPARWADPEAWRSPVRAVRNAAILVATGVMWLVWSIGMLVAFVAWLAANGPSLGALLAFPLLWFGVSWVLWSSSKRRRSRR